MDISNSYQTKNNFPARPNASDAFDYDLKSEKEEIEKITREVKNELLAKWKKSYANAQIFPSAVAAMHPDVVDFLLSFNLVSVYDSIAKQANLDNKGRNVLPKIVWQITQGKRWDSVDQLLESQLPLTHSMHILVVQLLKKDILDKVRVLNEKPVTQRIVSQQIAKKEIKLSLSDALLQYPKVGEQSVGSEQIKLRYFPTPVRPSIKNWITDFHDGMGAGKHSPMDRGNFLFHSENGKRLNSADRQKLGIILRSLDEQTLLTIDGDAQIILFQNNADETRNIGNAQTSLPSGHLSSSEERITMKKTLYGNDNNMDAVKVAPSVGNTQTSLPSGHLSSSEERMTMNKTLDRRNQIQQERNTHDVFGDLAPTPKNENIQDKQLNNKVQDFFAKPAAEKMQNIGNAPSSAHDYMGTFSQREKGELKKTSEPDNYFSIPQSKPPIGSEEFHIAKTDNAQIGSVPSSALSGTFSLPTGRQASGEKDDVKKTVNGLDRDSMSDEDLFNILREKKSKQDAAKLNSSVGNFKFSSPQKLPAEQEKQPVKTLVQQPLRQQAAPSKQNNFSIKPSSQIQKSPYHISPSDYEYGKKTEGAPKVNGNVVDLKN
ncbi:MAG: hypothetical protein PHP62_02960 [Candidatus Moranbacteria bacterium]|nr:hypothetical protein [Candidatus Moranbacteria bacterium]